MPLNTQEHQNIIYAFCKIIFCFFPVLNTFNDKAYKIVKIHRQFRFFYKSAIYF